MPADAGPSRSITVMTGATSGIGRLAAGELARRGHHLFLVGRNPDLTSRAVAEIRADSGNPEVEGLIADLSSMAQVRQLADQLHDRCPHIDLLVNNAGAIFIGRRDSVDGFEMTLALNHLAYFLLTRLLLGRLGQAARGRVVNVASEAHRNARLDFDDLQMVHKYGGWPAYQRSKLANILFTRELARRTAASGLEVACLHPGFIATGFGDANGGLFALGLKAAKRFAAESVPTGASRIVFLATTPELVPGAYYVRNQPLSPAPLARSDEAASRLWEISERLTAGWVA